MDLYEQAGIITRMAQNRRISITSPKERESRLRKSRLRKRLRTLLDERIAAIAAGYQHDSLILADIDQSALKVRRKLSVLKDSDHE